MLHNGRRLLKLINNLLDFTKIESGKMELHKEKINIPELLGFYVSTAKSAADSRRLNLIFIDNTEGVTAFVDRDLFEKAVFNLISNSFKFTPSGGTVIVQLDISDGQASVSVKDTGIGIPEEKQNYIFDRFAQLENSPSRKNEGAGIGLSLTKEIIELHGGTISVKSREGKGSVFTLTFPADGIGETGSRQYAAIDRNSEGISSILLAGISETIHSDGPTAQSIIDNTQSILIIEDNRELKDFLKNFLEKEYSIFTAGNGKEGLDMAVLHKPDLILSDVMMPEMDGYEMTRQIRNNIELKGIPIILLTAKADPEMKISGLELGAVDYITKPFNLRELSARIKSQLEMKTLRDEVIIREKKLEESEIRFKEMAELLPVAIINLDLSGKVKYMNRTGLELLGIKDANNITDSEITDFVDASDSEKLKKEMRKALKDKNPDLTGIKMRNKKESGINTLAKITAIIENGAAKGFRLIIIEIKLFLEKAVMPDEDFFKTYGLSERESEVLRNILKGYSNKQLHEKLFISENTVKTHLKAIYQKLGISSREELFSLVKSRISKNASPDSLMISVLNSIITGDE
jgi:PAS domain S-box-containing protein